MNPNHDIASQLRAIADAVEQGHTDGALLVSLAKITRALSGLGRPTANLDVESVFGAITRKGLVRFAINDEWVMLEPDEARTQAIYILDAAGSAEFDEFVYTDMAAKMDLDDDGASRLLMAFREWRTKGEK